LTDIAGCIEKEANAGLKGQRLIGPNVEERFRQPNRRTRRERHIAEGLQHIQGIDGRELGICLTHQRSEACPTF
jgi:hypothetical protein